MTTGTTYCREHLTGDDFDFVAANLSDRPRRSAPFPDASVTPHSTLHALLSEPSTLEAALESNRIVKALLESPANISVSPQMYFYILVRRMLREYDRDVADYIAGVLASFVAPHTCPSSNAPTLNISMSDLLIALKSASSEKEFAIRIHVGNCTLFLSGIFPQHIAERSTRRASPSLAFHEEVGSTNYRLAANHRLARRDGLADTLQTMADHFTEVRVGLNRLADQFLCLEPTGGLTA